MMGPGGHTPPPGYMPPESDAAVQIAWGLDYIAGRYGDPSAAWGFHQANGYYAKGGMATGPHMGIVGEVGRELMLPLDNAAVKTQVRDLMGTVELRQTIAQEMGALRRQNQELGERLNALVGALPTDIGERMVEDLPKSGRFNDNMSRVGVREGMRSKWSGV
jgi:hypothetical protein